MRRYEHESCRAASSLIHDGQEIPMVLAKGFYPSRRHVCWRYRCDWAQRPCSWIRKKVLNNCHSGFFYVPSFWCMLHSLLFSLLLWWCYSCWYCNNKHPLYQIFITLIGLYFSEKQSLTASWVSLFLLIRASTAVCAKANKKYEPICTHCPNTNRVNTFRKKAHSFAQFVGRSMCKNSVQICILTLFTQTTAIPIISLYFSERTRFTSRTVFSDYTLEIYMIGNMDLLH